MTEPKRAPRRRKSGAPKAAELAGGRARAAASGPKQPRARKPRASAPGAPPRKGAPAGPQLELPLAPRPPARRAPPPAGGPPLGWIAAGLAALAIALGAAFAFGWASLPGPGTGKDVEVDWPAGLDDDAAVAKLASLGLVGAPSLFRVYLALHGGAAALRPGPHLLADDLSPRRLVQRLSRSLLVEHTRVTLPEGVHRFEIARRLQQAHVCGARAFVAATGDAATLRELGIAGESAEGFLFPATYDLPIDADPKEVVARLKAEFDKRFDKLAAQHPDGLDALRATLGWGVRDLVTLASVVEREAAVDDERPLVASVFLNRLRDPTFVPKRLQSDATTAYGCIAAPERAPSCRAWAGRVTPEMNQDEGNAYSTYRHDGLPPGPIANPGERSLVAVLAPADTRYFFFVTRGERRHAFSETLSQHEGAIRKSPPR